MRRRVTEFKIGVLHRLSALASSAGARRPVALAQALALLFEGAYAASQTHGPGNALVKAIPEIAETLLQRHGV